MAGSWDITITDNNGTTHSPALYSPRGEALPRRKPAANDRPTLEFGVKPKRDSNGDAKWLDSKFDEADVSVAYNNTTQPYSTIIGVEDRPLDGIVVLEAIGGEELEKPVDVTFDGAVPTDEAARRVITDNTSYGVDAPQPSTTVTEDVLVEDETDGFAASDLVPPDEDVPVYVTDEGTVTLHQTLFFDQPSTDLSTVGDSVSFTFTSNYSIPSDRVGVAIDTDTTGPLVGLELSVDGAVIGTVAPGTTTDSAPAWIRREGSDERLAPGTHELVVEVTAVEDASGADLTAMSPTGVAVYDDGYGYTWDPDLVNGPQLYPLDRVDAVFKEPLVTRAVTGVSARGYFAANDPGPMIVGNGETDFAAMGPQVDTDFADPGAVATLRIGLNASGQDASKTPETGHRATEVTGYKLRADLETLPLVVGETFEGTVADVLTELTDTLRGDFVWTYDTDGNGDPIVRFVRSGARSQTQDALEGYRLKKRMDGVLDEVRVLGGDVRVDGEAVRVEHGSAVELDRDRVVKSSETVTSPDGQTVYERGTHYTIDYESGTITADDSPSRTDPIPNNSLVRVSYEFQPSATVTRDGATDPLRSETVDMLALRSDRACRLAAQYLVDATGTPTYEASATIRGNVTYSPVAELVGARLPTGLSLDTVTIEADAGGTDVRLDAQQSLGGAVQALQERIERVARYSR